VVNYVLTGGTTQPWVGGQPGSVMGFAAKSLQGVGYLRRRYCPIERFGVPGVGVTYRRMIERLGSVELRRARCLAIPASQHARDGGTRRGIHGYDVYSVNSGNVTVAVALFVESAWLVAVSCTVPAGRSPGRRIESFGQK